MSVAETARLRLRELTPEDAPLILELLNDPAFLHHVGDRGVKTLDDARQYILAGPMASYTRFGAGLYRVELKATGAGVGICGLLKRDGLEDFDIGFALLPQHRSRGYAAEAAAAVLARARDALGLERVVAIVSPGNERSVRVLERIGFSFERMIRLAAGEPEIELFAAAL
jgi:RimJ/RimL family protein N-acetyltransferase